MNPQPLPERPDDRVETRPAPSQRARRVRPRPRPVEVTGSHLRLVEDEGLEAPAPRRGSGRAARPGSPTTATAPGAPRARASAPARTATPAPPRPRQTRRREAPRPDGPGRAQRGGGGTGSGGRGTRSGGGRGGGGRRAGRGGRYRRPWFRRPLLLLLVFPVSALAFVVLVAGAYLFQSTNLENGIVGQQATTVTFSDGSEMGTLQPEYARQDVPLESLPEHVVQAVLAAEDADFYEHPGVSVAGLFRAALRNVTTGRINQGGSTITQQYVKLVVLKDSSQTLARKLNEAVLAVKLDRRYSKDEILEFYLNSIYFGRGAYGVEAAAKAFFGISASELTVDQAALLAGFIPAPGRTDPLENPERAAERLNYVVDRMFEEGWITPGGAGRIRAEATPARVASLVLARSDARFNEAPFFMRMVEEELVARLGADAAYSGLTVETTLDPRLQDAAEEAYDDGFNNAFVVRDPPTGAIVSIDRDDGAVRAIVGGKDYAGDQVNLVTFQPGRQPGSTFKPFALAAFIEQGLSPESTFDGPAEIEVPGVVDDDGEPYVPGNYEGQEYGAVTVRQATRSSINTVYMQIAQKVTPSAVAETAVRAGIHEGLRGDVSLVLGTQEVTPLELAEAYNTFADEGVHHEPYTIDRVLRKNGTDEPTLVYAATDEGERVFEQGVAATVTDVLRGVISSGTGTRAEPGVPAAGKTGTTQDYADAWFAGYTSELTTVVWMGNRDNNETMTDRPSGGSYPAIVWGEFMRAASDGVEQRPFPEPLGGLSVFRGAAPETPDEPSCGSGETASRDEDGDLECIAAPEEEPSEIDESTDEASPDATPTPEAESAGEEDAAAPAPATAPQPRASQAPAPAPAPAPTAAPPPPPPPASTAPAPPSPPSQPGSGGGGQGDPPAEGGDAGSGEVEGGL